MDRAGAALVLLNESIFDQTRYELMQFHEALPRFMCPSHVHCSLSKLQAAVSELVGAGAFPTAGRRWMEVPETTHREALDTLSQQGIVESKGDGTRSWALTHQGVGELSLQYALSDPHKALAIRSSEPASAWTHHELIEHLLAQGWAFHAWPRRVAQPKDIVLSDLGQALERGPWPIVFRPHLQSLSWDYLYALYLLSQPASREALSKAGLHSLRHGASASYYKHVRAIAEGNKSIDCLELRCPYSIHIGCACDRDWQL